MLSHPVNNSIGAQTGLDDLRKDRSVIHNARALGEGVSEEEHAPHGSRLVSRVVTVAQAQIVALTSRSLEALYAEELLMPRFLVEDAQCNLTQQQAYYRNESDVGEPPKFRHDDPNSSAHLKLLSFDLVSSNSHGDAAAIHAVPSSVVAVEIIKKQSSLNSRADHHRSSSGSPGVDGDDRSQFESEAPGSGRQRFSLNPMSN